MSNFEDVKKFMKTFVKKIITKPKFPGLLAKTVISPEFEFRAKP